MELPRIRVATQGGDEFGWLRVYVDDVYRYRIVGSSYARIIDNGASTTRVIGEGKERSLRLLCAVIAKDIYENYSKTLP